MKMYQAIDENICIKEFGPELLPGWFATSKEALEAFRSEPQDEQPTGEQTEPGNEAKPRKAGRPKKAK